jgi:hypothetical protein
MNQPSIQIPEHIAEALEAMAKHQGITQSELVVRILEGALDNPFYQPYIHDGQFDETSFNADLKRTCKALNQWWREHPEERARLTRIGMAGIRGRIASPKDLR